MKEYKVKYGPHGKFLACPGFQNVRILDHFLVKIKKCPLCRSILLERLTPKTGNTMAVLITRIITFATWKEPVMGKSVLLVADYLIKNRIKK